MSCQKLIRQSLYMVLRGGDLYSLSTMDVSRLFYRSKAEAIAAHAKVNEKNSGSNILPAMGTLPDATIHYGPLKSAVSYPNVFGLLGKSDILCSNPLGDVSIYRADSHSFLSMPNLTSPKGSKCMVVSMPNTAAHAWPDFFTRSRFFTANSQGEHTDSLCIMDMDPDNPCSFEVVVYHPMRGWVWRPLPLPPFLGNPEYKAPDNIPFTVVDGTMICVSSDTSTYSFDMVALEWRKLGDWVLPFHAKAEYIPELHLWFGLLAHSPYNLCSFDLSGVTMGSCDKLYPVQDFELDKDLLVGDRSLKDLALVNLGSCRFCIAKFFNVNSDQGEAQVLVLTGVEVEPCDDQEGGKVRMIKHKFECLPADRIVCVL